MTKLEESIDLYNAAVEFRDNLPIPEVAEAADFVVDQHLKQFEQELLMSDYRCGEWN